MICLIDIETTGLDPCFHDVIEVGAILANKGRVFDEFEFSLDFNMDKADPKALEVNGWGKRNFAPKVSSEHGRHMLRATFEDGVTFCSWHTTLDECFLAQLFRRVDEKPPWSHRRVIDLPSLVMGKMGVITAGSTRELMEQLGLDPDFEGRHRALEDARANFRVYKELKLYEV